MSCKLKKDKLKIVVVLTSVVEPKPGTHGFRGAGYEFA